MCIRDRRRHVRRTGSDLRRAQNADLPPGALREFAFARDSRVHHRKAPSAELRPEQKDSDSLPPYEVLDTILADYIEDNRSPDAIAAQHSYDPELVRKVVRMVDKSEYKRQQAAPGLKISEKAFGFGRRYPIAAKAEM